MTSRFISHPSGKRNSRVQLMQILHSFQWDILHNNGFTICGYVGSCVFMKTIAMPTENSRLFFPHITSLFQHEPCHSNHLQQKNRSLDLPHVYGPSAQKEKALLNSPCGMLPLQFCASITWASALGEMSWTISLAHSHRPCSHATWRGVFPSWSCRSSETPFTSSFFTTVGWFR